MCSEAGGVSSLFGGGCRQAGMEALGDPTRYLCGLSGPERETRGSLASAEVAAEHCWALLMQAWLVSFRNWAPMGGGEGARTGLALGGAPSTGFRYVAHSLWLHKVREGLEVLAVTGDANSCRRRRGRVGSCCYHWELPFLSNSSPQREREVWTQTWVPAGSHANTHSCVPRDKSPSLSEPPSLGC